MSLKRKNFIHINKGFVCENCAHKNPKAKATCRNHCKNCLYSKHVDERVPGDRGSDCLGIMEPVDFEYEGARGYLIVHKCKKCNKVSRNKLAEDDNLQEFSKLTLCTRKFPKS